MTYVCPASGFSAAQRRPRGAERRLAVPRRECARFDKEADDSLESADGQPDLCRDPGDGRVADLRLRRAVTGRPGRVHRGTCRSMFFKTYVDQGLPIGFEGNLRISES